MTTKWLHVNFVIDYDTFSDDLLSFRKKAELTQSEIAEWIGMSDSLVSKIETRQYLEIGYDVRISTFLKICNMMDCDPRKYFLLDKSIDSNVILNSSSD